MINKDSGRAILFALYPYSGVITAYRKTKRYRFPPHICIRWLRKGFWPTEQEPFVGDTTTKRFAKRFAVSTGISSSTSELHRLARKEEKSIH